MLSLVFAFLLLAAGILLLGVLGRVVDPRYVVWPVFLVLFGLYVFSVIRASIRRWRRR